MTFSIQRQRCSESFDSIAPSTVDPTEEIALIAKVLFMDVQVYLRF
jgi:hypothetical protein